MLKFCNKEKGAISVFLILIMLPMMVLSWIMIDGGRIQLAKDRINNLADLTYNTALSQYDQTLKDVYGLLAMSQDEKSLLSNLNDYYERSLMSAGLDPETSAALSDNIIQWLGDQVSSGNVDNPNYADFLKMEISDFTVSNPALSAVYNPNIMEEQIVDYMKYRAPLGIGVKIIQALKSFGTLSDQSKVIEKKKEYYEEQKSLEEELQKAWGYIERYNTYTKGSAAMPGLSDDGKRIKLNESGLQTANNRKNNYLTKLDTPDDRIKADKEKLSVFEVLCNVLIRAVPIDNTNTPDGTKYYHKIGEKTDLGWTNGSLGTDISFSSEEELTEHNEKVKSENETDGVSPHYVNMRGVSYTKVHFNDNYIDFTEKDECAEDDDEGQSTVLQNFNSALELCKKYDNAIKNLSGYINVRGTYFDRLMSTYNTMPSYGLSTNSWDAPYSGMFIEEAYEAYNDFTKGLDIVCGINFQWGDDLSSFLSYINSYSVNVKKLIENYYKLTSSNQTEKKTDFEKYCKSYLQYWRVYYILNHAVSGWFYGTEYYDKVVGAASTVINEIYTEQKNLHDDLVAARDNLDNAKKHLMNAKGKIGDLDTARGNWRQSVDNNDSVKESDFGDGNLSEISSLEGKFKASDFEWLITRITNMISSLDELISQIDKLTYGEKKLYEIPDARTLYEVTVNTTTYQKKPGASFQTSDAKTILHVETDLTYSWTVTSDSNCKHIEFGKANNELYKYMSTQYAGASKYLEGGGSNQSSDEGEKKAERDTYTNKAKDPEITNVTEPDGNKDTSKSFNVGDANSGGDISTSSGGNVTVSDALPSKLYSGARQADLDASKMAALGKTDGKEPENGVDGGSEAASGFFDSALAKLKNAATEIRDDIYIMEYIMGMFSYQTIEKEFAVEKFEWNKKEALSDKFYFYAFRLYEKNGDNITNATFNLPSVDWSMDKLREQLRTLSNEQICPQYNYAYLNEVEYIIYGEGGEKTAWLVIAGIRMLCNTIAAFMNSEITSLARTIAWSIFVGPLAFLAPIAQIAIIIAFAIGETIVDKKMLEAGVSVPIFKTKETWMISPSGLMKAVKGEAAKVVENLAYKAIDKMAGDLEEAIDGLDKAASNTIDDAKKAVDDKFGELYDAKIGTHIDTAIDYIMKECEETMNNFATTLTKDDLEGEIDGDITFEKILNSEKLKKKLVSQVKDKVEVWANSGGDDLLGKAKKLVYEKFLEKEGTKDKIESVIEDKLTLIIGKTESGMNAAVTRLSELPGKIKEKVMTAVQNGTGTIAGSIKKLKDDAIDEVKNAVSEGKDKLKSVVNDKLDGMLGDTGFENKSVSSSDAASMIALSYSGYLRLFLFISLLTGKQGVLLRTADVIQTNMRLRTGKEDYCLSKSYSYMELNIEADLEPLFLSFDGLKKVLSSPDSSVDDDTVRSPYTIQYSGRNGY